MTIPSQHPEASRNGRPIRRLDHVAIAVRDVDEALGYFRDRLGLRVVSSEEVWPPGVRLTYLDCGNAYLQLVQPLAERTDVGAFLDGNGEGIHHLCFSVDDVVGAVGALSLDGDSPPELGSGRGRVSSFLPGPAKHGVRIECTEFRRDEDVDAVPGWLP